MKRKIKPITLVSPQGQSAKEVRAMTGELTGGTVDTIKPSRWGKRFAASGKRSAPKLRLY